MLTLTPIDSAVGAFEVLPNTDPTTGIVTFTGRPAREDRDRATLHALLTGLGVDVSVSASSMRAVDDNLLNVTARLRAYDVKAIVIRHATYVPMSGLRALFDLCRHERILLALTCDDTIGEDLADWVNDHNGTVHTSLEPLTNRLSLLQRPEAPLPVSSSIVFPHHLPETGWYNYRSRCQNLLNAEDYALVDALYVDVARNVYAQPFTSPEDASTRLHDWHQRHPYPGQLRTILRAAEAAMFKHGQALKTNEKRLMATVEQGQYQTLTPAEIRSLRAYYPTWKSAARALNDAGLSVNDIHALTVNDVNTNGSLNGTHNDVTPHPEAARLIAVHRHYRRLEGAKTTDPFINRVVSNISTNIRGSSTDLNLPAVPAHEGRGRANSLRWDLNLGVTLDPLTGRLHHLKDHEFGGPLP